MQIRETERKSEKERDVLLGKVGQTSQEKKMVNISKKRTSAVFECRLISRN